MILDFASKAIWAIYHLLMIGIELRKQALKYQLRPNVFLDIALLVG